VLDLAGAFVVVFAGILLGVAWAWSQLPDRRAGGYLRYPERLWGASVGVMAAYALIGLLIFAAR